VYLDFTLEAKNKGGHSSMPVKDNAIYRLAAALTRVQALEFPVTLNETTRMSFARTALGETGQIRADMLAAAATPTDMAAANRLAASSPYYNSMLRTTCVATMLSGGHAENALPQSARANVNCRMLPDDTLENVLATLKSAVADPGVSVTCAHASVAAPRSPVRQDVMDAVERITNSLWPGVVVTPVMSTGATDGKYLRAAGIPVYGVSGMFGEIDDVRAHGRDERIGVKEFYEGLEFMYRFIKTLGD
jgi:acetylornithine deacetylase/succinyl-diaminopimelate desuccinylase-like protein